MWYDKLYYFAVLERGFFLMSSPKLTVAVLFGGASTEHDVSQLSVTSVLRELDRDKYELLPVGITRSGEWFLYTGELSLIADGRWEQSDARIPCLLSPVPAHHGLMVQKADGWQPLRVDLVFPVLHGMNGEDGTIQGLLTIAGIPFVGCNTEASAVCMDKAVTNALADFYGIPQAKWTAFDRHAYAADKALLLKTAADKLGFPIFVKPANTGSSVGVTKVCSFDELAPACEKAFEFDKKIVLEEGIDGVEIECAVLGNEEPIASVVGEIVPCNDFYDYDAKYLAGDSELHIPARLPEEKLEAVRAAAVNAFRSFGCSGLTRVDFFVRRSDGEILLNEPNTIPGFTEISMYPKLFAASGIPYPELLDKLINYAIERQ